MGMIAAVFQGSSCAKSRLKGFVKSLFSGMVMIAAFFQWSPYSVALQKPRG